MEKKVYLELDNVQNSYWWFVAKREIIMFLLKEYKTRLFNQSDKKLNLCDMGCGMGVLLNDLSKHGNVYGMDCEPMAIEYCAKSFGYGIGGNLGGLGGGEGYSMESSLMRYLLNLIASI